MGWCTAQCKCGLATIWFGTFAMLFHTTTRVVCHQNTLSHIVSTLSLHTGIESTDSMIEYL